MQGGCPFSRGAQSQPLTTHPAACLTDKADAVGAGSSQQGRHCHHLIIRGGATRRGAPSPAAPWGSLILCLLLPQHLRHVFEGCEACRGVQGVVGQCR